jgi:hypothetical protein
LKNEGGSGEQIEEYLANIKSIFNRMEISKGQHYDQHHPD